MFFLIMFWISQHIGRKLYKDAARDNKEQEESHAQVSQE